jgi:acetate kinase
LAGLSGVAGGDVRDLEAAAADGNARARLALEVFTYEVKKTIGAFAAAMGGLDAVAFTGGIGENSPRLRAACCQGLEFLGIRMDAARNESGAGDRVVSAGHQRRAGGGAAGVAAIGGVRRFVETRGALPASRVTYPERGA